MNCAHMDHSASDDLFLPTDYIKLRQDSKITSLYTLLPLPREVNSPEGPAGSVKRGPGRPRKADAPLKLDELDTSDLILLLLIFLLFREGEDEELLIALGLLFIL